MELVKQIQQLASKGKIVIMSEDDFRTMRNNQAKDAQKRICDTKTACHILDVHPNKFYNLTKEKDSLIRPSKLKGKWALKSILDEADRLNGELKS